MPDNTFPALDAQRREDDSGYRLIEPRDIATGYHAVQEGSGLQQTTIAIGLGVMLLVVLFLTRWVISLWHEIDVGGPPETPAASPSRPKVEADIEERPAVGGEVKDASRWRPL